MAVPGEAKLGFLPDTCLLPGPLGIMSKSGTLSYESGYRLVQHNVGQSVWVGVGGDPVKGVRFADLVPFYAADAQTEAVLIIGEIGGAEVLGGQHAGDPLRVERLQRVEALAEVHLPAIRPTMTLGQIGRRVGRCLRDKTLRVFSIATRELGEVDGRMARLRSTG